ncbi:sodium:solute symporter family protein [Fodinisporobacter ferrooxydans]|uniref:Sodium:solute symporter family protein n=1 Tax=Fodinisporobacter ferrooxydans TaxID=2901836 RepID=A0ABY4CNH6_9BACL|nr:sodium:solute symporter family protein [Alicyclobacillaceae bacterium MYW30-H2]
MRPIFVIGMGIYVILVVILSIVAGRRIKDAKGFFLADKQLGWYLIAAGLISQAVGGGSTIGLAAAGYTLGMQAWWKLGPVVLGVLIMGLLLARPLANMRQITHPQILEDRFSNTARTTGLIYYLAQSISSVGAQMLALGALLSLVTGLPILMSAALAGVVMCIWVIFGGMLGTAWGDLVHWFIFVIGLIILIPLTLSRAGGLSHVLTAPGLKHGFGNIFNISPGVAIGFVILTLPSIFVRQAYFQRLLSEKSAKDGLVGTIIATIIMFPIYLLIPVIGLSGHYLFAHIKASEVFPSIAINLFPTALGVIFFAALASAIMSSAGGELLSATSNVTQDIYVRLINPSSSEKTKVRVARIVVVLLTIVSFLML